MNKHFGQKPSKADIERYQESDNWTNGSFVNLEHTTMDVGLSKMPGMIYKQIKGGKPKNPPVPLPIESFEKETFLSESDRMKFIWYGHSVVLMRLNGKTILIDPMLGPDASPIAPFRTKRFSENTLELINQFPHLDLVLLTHDHYDHLDLESIKRLQSKTDLFYVALGVKRHLTSWGIPEDSIREFDWWDSAEFGDMTIHFTPTRHFSGRGLTDRAKSLWGGWAFISSSERIWFSGDGGYGNHFKEIGKRLGPFDFAFMECGQYCDDWAQIHMFPQEAVLAAQDAGAKRITPVHWGGFSLSYFHNWYEPVEEFVEHSKREKVDFVTPKPGELVEVDGVSTVEWWKEFV